MFASQHVRPIPLLDSDASSEDDYITPTTKRLSYAALVNMQPLSRYHKLVIAFVCAVTLAQSLQLYIPLLLTTHLGCEMRLSTADRSLLAVSYPLSHFIAPLFNAVLTKCSIKKRLAVALSFAMLLVLSTLLCKTVHPMVVLRCLAGMLIVPESTLTQLWAHVFPQALHTKCRVVISSVSATGFAVSLLLLLTHSSDIRFFIALSSLTFIPAVALSLWVVETPLMQLRHGKYSQIMTSIKTVFNGPMINSLRLQEIDFSDDSSTNSWNPVYLFSEVRNKHNSIIVGAQRVAQGFLLATVLCTFPSLILSQSSCIMDKISTVNCTRIHSDAIAQHQSDNSLIAVTISSTLGTHLVPVLALKHELFLISITSTLSFALLSACIFNTAGQTVLLCLIAAAHSSFNSAVSHLASTVSISIAGECFAGLLFTVAMVIGKLISDETRLGVLVTCSVLMCLVLLTGFVVRVPPTKDTCNEMVEMDDPIVETLEMELEIVEEEEKEEEEGDTSD